MNTQRDGLQSPVLSRSMLIWNLLYSMVPLLGFWLVEKYWSLEAGVIAAVILALLEVIWVYWKERRLEPFATWSAVLVLLMGLISWQMHSTVFLRLKPAIFEGIFACLFLISSLMDKPFMLIIARKQFGDMEIHPFQLRYLTGVNWRIGMVFLLHTAITVYAALYLSMDAWAFVKGVLFYLLFFVFFLAEFFYSRFSLRRQIEEASRQQAFLEYQRNIILQMRKTRLKPPSEE